MVLVVGATGLVGKEVCLRLVQRGRSVRALVRTSSDPATVDSLKAAGVELCYGDLKDPDSLAEACRDMEAVVSTATSTTTRADGDSIHSVDQVGQLNLVAAAKAAHIDRFVFVSFQRPKGVSVPLADAKAEVEDAIAGMNYTVIQASWFMEMWLSPRLGFDYTNGTARIFGAGVNPICWVSYRDVAEMCVVALQGSATSRRTLAFGGPQALSPQDVIRTFEKLTGRTFQVEYIPQDALYQQFVAATDPMEKSFAALALGYAAGDSIDMRPIVRDFGIELTRLEAYARQVLALQA